MAPAVRQAFFGFYQSTESILRRGIAAGEFRRVEPHALHIALIGSLMYYALTAPAREVYLRSGQAPTTTDPTPASYLAEIP